jgi:CTP synthase
VQKLREIGIQPDALLCRADRRIPDEERDKISLFTNVPAQGVISMWDVDTIYKVPRMLHEQGLDEMICMKLQLLTRPADLKRWDSLVHEVEHPLTTVKIGMCGKYTDLSDSYKSLNEALRHAGIQNHARVNIEYVDSETLNESNIEQLSRFDAVPVPGGFGKRGVEGKICAARYAREHQIPYLGICLGMQVATIEVARHLAGLAGANSTEFEPEAESPVIHMMASQRDVVNLGGTMRLGAYTARLRPASKAALTYGTNEISERHRHRLEVNNAYRDVLAEFGLRLSGQSPDGGLVEMIELPDHPFFLGCQFHPELKSRPNRPHPLFAGFVGAALKRRMQQRAGQPSLAEVSAS